MACTEALGLDHLEPDWLGVDVAARAGLSLGSSFPARVGVKFTQAAYGRRGIVASLELSVRPLPGQTFIVALPELHSLRP